MIYLTNNKITIQNYNKIIKVDENEIVFMILKQMVFVSGNNLFISYLENDEFQIQGKINDIKFND